MGIHFFYRIAHKFRAFMILQLFITCISLPILIWWGLPVSLLSPLGNLFFSPFLTAFLTIASLLFFTELLCIPNGFFAWLLDGITTIWLKLLAWHPPGMLHAFAQPPLWILLLPPIAALIIISHHTTKHPKKSGALLALTLFLFCFALKTVQTQDAQLFGIECNGSDVIVLHKHNTITIIDPGAIGRRPSGPSWVQYNLLSQLAKKTGCRHINHLVLCKINKTTF